MSLLACLFLWCAAQDPPARVPWTGSRVVGSPENPPPYRVEREFPKLQFLSPVDMLPVPGTDLLAVAELGGTVRVFENRPDADQAIPVARVNGLLLGIAFHPKFSENGYLYIFAAPRGGTKAGVYRLTLRQGLPLKAVSGSELFLLHWPFGGVTTHGGGGLRFGPDGYLYVGVGDCSEGGDPLETGQNLGNLESKILRIDVDRPSPGAAYGIPPDNPFLDRSGARPEIWAYGVRQPWRISFDSQGTLWVGDVGQDRWEAVLRVRRGENFGWSVLEGGHPYRPSRKLAPGPIAPPVVTHDHSEFRALIGGLVYGGKRHEDLAGSYLYGDHETGRIWELRLEGDTIARNREIAATPLRITGFAEDARHEFHVLSFADGGLYRLVPNTGAARNDAFPKRLSETGLFESVQDLRPARGIVPYEVNSPLWSDGADKVRLLALPGTSRIRPDCIRNNYVRLTTSATWDFPDGTVLVKTFSLGDRRVETRLLHLERVNPALDIRSQVWRGYSYQWNEAQTDADLVDAAGCDREVSYPGPSGARRQMWRFPSRNQCAQCHDMAAHFVLGVTTPQLNREVQVPGAGRMNQLDWFQTLGLFETPLPPVSSLPRLVDPYDQAQPLELRARSYLHANCAHCHVLLGEGNSEFQAHFLTPLEKTGLIGRPPVHGNLGVQEGRLVAPSSPERSILLNRMERLDESRMPPLASAVVDSRALEMLAQWVRGMPRPDLQTPPPDGLRGMPEPVRQNTWIDWLPASVVIALLAGLMFYARKRSRGEKRTEVPPAGDASRGPGSSEGP